MQLMRLFKPMANLAKKVQNRHLSSLCKVVTNRRPTSRVASVVSNFENDEQISFLYSPQRDLNMILTEATRYPLMPEFWTRPNKKPIRFPDYHMEKLRDIATRLRIHTIKATEAAGSGHPTTCASIAEIMAVLYFEVMRLNPQNAGCLLNDRLILSKGHAAPILYAAWSEMGIIPREDLLTLRKMNSDLEGNPMPHLSFVDVATGSLGQGISVGCGMAYISKLYDKIPNRFYVICGDGEMIEGSNWEGLHFASLYKLDNLCVIIDVNGFGQSEATSLQHRISIFQERVAAFGCRAIAVDGHDVHQLCHAFSEASLTKKKPTVIIAYTLNGKDFPNIEDKEHWHSKILGKLAKPTIDHLEGLLVKSITADNGIKARFPEKVDLPKVDLNSIQLPTPPNYERGKNFPTRQAYGVAVAKLATSNNRVFVLDTDTNNSTFSKLALDCSPTQYIECFIGQQNMINVAQGLTCHGRCVAFASTFAAFLSRAFDQIRMAAISGSNINIGSCHAGIASGEDGAPQMALEDIASFRTINGSTVFYPADAVACERAVELAANTKGICYIRTCSPTSMVIYENDEKFKIGEGKIVRESNEDQALLIGAGLTLLECLKAADSLKNEGINVRVIDPFTIKPLDHDLILRNSMECGGRIVVVEDHYQSGGLGEAVLSSMAPYRDFVVKHLYVTGVGRSGPVDELYFKYGICDYHIEKAVNELLEDDLEN